MTKLYPIIAVKDVKSAPGANQISTSTRMIHYKFITVIFFCLLTFATSFGQLKPGRSKPINQIKSIYQQINDFKNYELILIEDAEEILGHATDNGASLTGYFNKGILKKIVLWVGLSNKVIQQEYYLDKDKLVFVYSKESRYRFNDSNQSFDYSKLDNVSDARYYFSNDKLIHTIFNDKKYVETKAEDSAFFLTSVKDYMTLLTAKRK